VVFNLSDERQVVRLNDEIKKARNLLRRKQKFEQEMILEPYQFMVWQVRR
jgi:hypothetical protein